MITTIASRAAHRPEELWRCYKVGLLACRNMKVFPFFCVKIWRIKLDHAWPEWPDHVLLAHVRWFSDTLILLTWASLRNASSMFLSSTLFTKSVYILICSLQDACALTAFIASTNPVFSHVLINISLSWAKTLRRKPSQAPQLLGGGNWLVKPLTVAVSLNEDVIWRSWSWKTKRSWKNVGKLETSKFLEKSFRCRGELASPATNRRISTQNFEVCNTSIFLTGKKTPQRWKGFFLGMSGALAAFFDEVLPGGFGTNEKSVNVIVWGTAPWSFIRRDFGEIKFGGDVSAGQAEGRQERKASWGSFLVKRFADEAGPFLCCLHHRRLLQVEGPKVGESEDWRWLMAKDFRSSWPTSISFPFFKFSSPWAVAGLRRSWTDIPPSYLQRLSQVKELSLRPYAWHSHHSQSSPCSDFQSCKSGSSPKRDRASNAACSVYRLTGICDNLWNSASIQLLSANLASAAHLAY